MFLKIKAKYISSYCIFYGVITLVIPNIVYGNEPDKKETAAINTRVEFNSDFLIADAKKIDISRFSYGNPILPGEYVVDVYINGNWFSKSPVVFKETEDNKNAYTCFTIRQLLEYGVKAEAIEALSLSDDKDCQPLSKWVKDSFYELDTSKLRIDISIP